MLSVTPGDCQDLLPRCGKGLLPLSPAASIGRILGEILGLNAGLTRLELTLPLFFALRPFISIFFPEVIENAGLVGVDMASSIGLGLFDMVAPGVPSGPNLGVLRAAMRGVSCSPSWKAVSSLDSDGLDSSEASGRARSSNMGWTLAEASNCGEGYMRMSEAGVAGVVPWPFCATKAGEFLTDPGRGGGRISDSIGSGEMESDSE